MEPDNYNLSSSKPVTALSAWMTIANLTRGDIVRLAKVSAPTVTAARAGRQIQIGSATMIAVATGIPTDVVHGCEIRTHWRFRLHGDRRVEVLP